MADTADIRQKIARESTFQSLLAANQDIAKKLTDIKSALDTQNINVSAWGGALSALATADKSSLVGAINELVSKRGDLSQLTTSAKTTIVAALNEINSYTELMRSSGAGRCNAYMIGNGRNLGEFTPAHSAVIQDGTFKGLQVGDYWTKSITYSYTDYDDGDKTKSETITPVMRLFDADFSLRNGDAVPAGHHAAVAPDDPFFFAKMNDTNTTEGGYYNSKMRQKYLKRAEAIFKAFFGESHVLKCRKLLVNAVTNGKGSGHAWYDSYCDLMNEPMVYGSYIFAPKNDGVTIPYIYTEDNAQLSLFRLRHDLISTRQHWWLRDVVSAAAFAGVYLDGDAYAANASYALGVRPVALIY